jgi:hypothetical protein
MRLVEGDAFGGCFAGCGDVTAAFSGGGAVAAGTSRSVLISGVDMSIRGLCPFYARLQRRGSLASIRDDAPRRRLP